VYRIATKIPRNETTYYRKRDTFNQERDPLKRAALFYYLNKNCFNGLYRTSRSGNFNVPFSPSRTGNYPALLEFENVARLLRHARFECCDFETLVKRHCQPGDFFFLDPPYSDSSRYPFREYFPGCFSFDDVPRLERVLDLIQKRGGLFVLTFSDRLNFKFKAKGWQMHRIRTRRNIGGFASSRKFVEDIVLTNVLGS
jgi:DNA adenine methylase